MLYSKGREIDLKISLTSPSKTLTPFLILSIIGRIYSANALASYAISIST